MSQRELDMKCTGCEKDITVEEHDVQGGLCAYCALEYAESKAMALQAQVDELLDGLQATTSDFCLAMTAHIRREMEFFKKWGPLREKTPAKSAGTTASEESQPSAASKPTSSATDTGSSAPEEV